MPKVIFTIQYELKANKNDEFLTVIKELKNLVKADGLESYSIYENKGKANHYEEIYSFSSVESYEAFDDNQDERINILVAKLNDLTVENSTKYSTLYEIDQV